MMKYEIWKYTGIDNFSFQMFELCEHKITQYVLFIKNIISYPLA